MNIEIRESSLLGCVELTAASAKDSRGYFRKIYQQEFFENIGITSRWVEQYFSTSVKGAIRGLHFQLPPFEHAKLIYCTAGEVLDVALDLRIGSPTYGKFEEFLMSESNAKVIYLPSGFAHGFCTISDHSTMVYNVSSEYVESHDSGIRWDSAGINWPIMENVISERDSNLPKLVDFSSPFKYSSLR